MRRVVVLGCGPAGLLAAHAASMHGADVQVFSIKQPSVIGGAQYLHEHIPGLTAEPDGIILTTTSGTREGYAKKLYGDSRTLTSWDAINGAGSKPAWSMQKAYKTLWGMYRDNIRHYHVRIAEDANELELIGADLYITTLPASFLCENDEHHFESIPIWVYRDFTNGVTVPPNTIIYNGHENMPWSRASNLFGHKSMEFPKRPTSGIPVGRELLRGFKPTGHNCDCNSQWMRVGRYGQWRRGVLVHHAFQEVTHAMQQMQ